MELDARPDLSDFVESEDELCEHKNIEPYVSSELFHSYSEDPVQFDEYRISFGLTVDIMERSSIKIFYIFKKEELTKSDPDEIGVFGLAYSFKM